jgi:hypothetical protein
MTPAQIPASATDREMWARCLRGYTGALGTGSCIDPNCEDVGINGQLDFYISVEVDEVRWIWQTYGLDTDTPQSLWHALAEFKFIKIDMTGYKFRRGLFKSDGWLGPVRMFLSVNEMRIDKQFDFGYLAATSPLTLFGQFDKWRAGKYPTSFDMEESIRRAV